MNQVSRTFIMMSWMALAEAFGAASFTGPSVDKPPTIVRFKENPIIRPEMLPGKDGANICGPSLIRAPRWLKNPLGKYYLYFADHKGSYIRLAYADKIEGPWKIHAPGTLQLDQMVAVARTAAGAQASEVKGGHIASPDVHVDDERREIRMYFHFQIAPKTSWGHRSGVAVSPDGIRFEPVGKSPIGEPYFRVFRWNGYYFAINRSAALARSRDGLTNFEVGNTGFAEAVGHKTLTSPSESRSVAAQKKDDNEDSGSGIRHTAIKIDGNVMTVFYSRVGDLPEMLMSSMVLLTGDWKNWRLSPPMPILAPEMDYEGVNVAAKIPSNADMRVLPRPHFRELRDPCIYREDGTTYLLYSVAGERGIAGSILRD
jgi:hypothetical protein